MPSLQLLLDDPALQLELRCGDPATPFTAVRLITPDTSSPWGEAGELRLASGLDPEGLRALLRDEPGALGYALEPKRRSLPEGLVELAEGAGLPLVVIPPAVHVERVFEAALAHLHRERPTPSASVHRYLLAALPSAKPERELLGRLHALTGASFVLLSPWGSTLARSGPSGWQPRSLEPRALAEGHHQFARQSALVLRLEEAGQLKAVLVALGTQARLAPLMALAREVLRLAFLQRALDEERHAAHKEALLGEWLRGDAEAAELRARLERFGLTLEGPYLVAAVSVELRARQSHQQRRQHQLLSTLKRAGDAFFGSLGLTVLSAVRGDHALWLYPGSDPDAQLGPLVRALQAASDHPFRLGVSLPQHDFANAATPYRQALLAAQTVRERQGGSTFSQLEPIGWVLEQQPEANLRALYAQLVEPIRRADESGKLWHTLKRYLHSSSDLKALAAELHIHVNTLRYRLKRIEEVVGQPLSRPDTLAQLHLAERIAAMVERGARP